MAAVISPVSADAAGAAVPISGYSAHMFVVRKVLSIVGIILVGVYSSACSKVVVIDADTGLSFGIETIGDEFSTGDPATGDGDETTTTTGEGDGDPTTGDGDPTTDDGDPTTGDGDETTTTTTTGEGDGDPPVSNCGWDPNNFYYDCGFEGEGPPEAPIECPDGLVEGMLCADTGLDGVGCCDGGNLWYCTGDLTVFSTACG